MLAVKILAVSDQIVDRIYTLATSEQFQDVEFILGCGDLPYTYLEYIVTVLNKPLYYVPGNHDPLYNPQDIRSRAEGCFNLDLRTMCHKNNLIGGFGGARRSYAHGANQYTQFLAYSKGVRMPPHLGGNRIRHGRALDILISHSPPFGIHDDTDPAHIGLRALNWLMRIAKPRYLLHGHTHFYRNNISQSDSQAGSTRVINVYPYKIIDLV